MQRVAYIANSKIPSRQANTVHVLNMSAALGENGVAVTLIARGDPSAVSEVYDDFGVERTFAMRLLPGRASKWLDRLLFVRFVRRVLRQDKIEFAYGRSWYGLLWGVPSNIPFAYDVHDFPSTHRQRLLLSLLFRRPNLLFVTAISKALADRYAGAYPGLNRRILAAPCAAKAPAQQLIMGQRDPGPLRVTYVGHLYEGRGIDLIIAVAARASDIEFHIVGGEDADIAKWRGRASSNTRFHGYVKPAELEAVYRRADICLAPYGTGVAVAGGGDTSAGMSPMKIFEYMAHAKAIIASDLPVLREVITPGLNGLLCPPNDVEAWLHAICSLGKDPVELERLGTAARQAFDRDFSWDRRARTILANAELLGAAFPGGKLGSGQ